MKKKVFGKGFMVVFLIFAFGAGSSLKVEGASTSRVEIELKENTSITDPKDPENPAIDNPDDEDNKPTEEKGPLSLDVVPNGFYFGTQKMYHDYHEYSAEAGSRQYLQVTDNRSAEIAGWTLKVRQDTYLTDSESGVELTGATLYLPQGTTKSVLASTEGDLTAQSVGITNQEQTIFFAANQEEGHGKGTSTNYWQSENVILGIPRDTVKEGSYKNCIYWVLTDGGPKN